MLVRRIPSHRPVDRPSIACSRQGCCTDDSFEAVGSGILAVVLALQERETRTMALDPTADRPLSSQLADVLRSEIHDGTRPPGSQLPTESEFHEI